MWQTGRGDPKVVSRSRMAQEEMCPRLLATELLAAGCGQQWAVGCAQVGRSPHTCREWAVGADISRAR